MGRRLALLALVGTLGSCAQAGVSLFAPPAQGAKEEVWFECEIEGYTISPWTQQEYVFGRSACRHLIQKAVLVRPDLPNSLGSFVENGGARRSHTPYSGDPVWLIPTAQVRPGSTWQVDRVTATAVFGWTGGEDIGEGIGDLVDASISGRLVRIEGAIAEVKLEGRLRYHYEKPASRGSRDVEFGVEGRVSFDSERRRVREFELALSSAQSNVGATWDYGSGVAHMTGHMVKASVLYRAVADPAADSIPVETARPASNQHGSGSHGSLGWIAFHSDRSGHFELYAADTLSPEPVRLLKESGEYDWNVSFFPDAMALAFTRLTEEGMHQVWRASSFGADAIALSREGSNGHVAVSPDGRRIAFSSTRDLPESAVGRDNGELYLMDADGGNPKRLTNDPAPDGVPSWSPDGTRIAFQNSRSGEFDLHVVEVATGISTPLLTGPTQDFHPAWSPDGTRLAFASTRDGRRHQNICVMDLRTRKVTRLTDGQGMNWFPAWSPDGRWIAFQSHRDGNWEIYVMREDGSEQMRITHNPSADRMPVWVPGGTLPRSR
ncbi:MAG TPA: DPP IV N-terminal domain-containing protein [Planctomycetota bacterium]|nr:DPP IV N-terminal domain-containing protein [Planctomycetota bacterium]